MNDIRDIAGFKSRRFVPILPDDCQVRPGTYGAELAFWLMGKLAQQGIVTSYPVAGERAWLLVFDAGADGFFDILCSNADGSDERWRIALARRGCGLSGRIAPSFDQARNLVNAIRFVLHGAVPRGEIDWRYDGAATVPIVAP